MLENPLLSVDESQSVIFQPKLNQSKQERSKKNFDANIGLNKLVKIISHLKHILIVTSESQTVI